MNCSEVKLAAQSIMKDISTSLQDLTNWVPVARLYETLQAAEDALPEQSPNIPHSQHPDLSDYTDYLDQARLRLQAIARDAKDQVTTARIAVEWYECFLASRQACLEADERVSGHLARLHALVMDLTHHTAGTASPVNIDEWVDISANRLEALPTILEANSLLIKDVVAGRQGTQGASLTYRKNMIMPPALRSRLGNLMDPLPDRMDDRRMELEELLRKWKVLCDRASRAIETDTPLLPLLRKLLRSCAEIEHLQMALIAEVETDLRRCLSMFEHSDGQDDLPKRVSDVAMKVREEVVLPFSTIEALASSAESVLPLDSLRRSVQSIRDDQGGLDTLCAAREHVLGIRASAQQAEGQAAIFMDRIGNCASLSDDGQRTESARKISIDIRKWEADLHTLIRPFAFTLLEVPKARGTDKTSSTPLRPPLLSPNVSVAVPPPTPPSTPPSPSHDIPDDSPNILGTHKRYLDELDEFSRSRINEAVLRVKAAVQRLTNSDAQARQSFMDACEAFDDIISHLLNAVDAKEEADTTRDLAEAASRNFDAVIAAATPLPARDSAKELDRIRSTWAEVQEMLVPSPMVDTSRHTLPRRRVPSRLPRPVSSASARSPNASPVFEAPSPASPIHRRLTSISLLKSPATPSSRLPPLSPVLSRMTRSASSSRVHTPFTPRRKYVANPHSRLDVAVGQIVNDLRVRQVSSSYEH